MSLSQENYKMHNYLPITLKKKNFGIFSYFYVLIKLLKTVFVCTIEKLYSEDALITSVSKSQYVKMQIAIMFRL